MAQSAWPEWTPCSSQPPTWVARVGDRWSLLSPYGQGEGRGTEGPNNYLRRPGSRAFRICSGCDQNEVQGRGKARELLTGWEFTITSISWQNRKANRHGAARTGAGGCWAMQQVAQALGFPGGQSLQSKGGPAPSCSLTSKWRWRRWHGTLHSWMCIAHSVLSTLSGLGGARWWMRQPWPQQQKDKIVTITR